MIKESNRRNDDQSSSRRKIPKDQTKRKPSVSKNEKTHEHNVKRSQSGKRRKEHDKEKSIEELEEVRDLSITANY